MRRLAPLIALALLVPPQAQARDRMAAPPGASLRGVNADAGWHALGPIVFVRTRDHDADLWSVRADGSDLRRLTSSRRDDTEPAWSPRGANVVFVRSGPDGPDLYALNLKGGRPERFLGDGRAPAWSPSGDRIAFVRTVDGNTDLYTADADGGDVIRVTSDPAVDTDPAWGPDGTRLTFASDRDGDFDIYTADPDGAAVRPITDDELDQRNPHDYWTWRDVGYDQGSEDDPTWCWQTIGVPHAVPGPATSCAAPGVHAYTGGAWGPYARLERGSNGVAHLWAWAGEDRQLTFGRTPDSDPAVRPASRAVVRGHTRAAGDLDQGLTGAQAWVITNGSGDGADEGPAGLIVEAPGLCLVDAGQRSRATATACAAGTGTGSTSVYADADEIALARDTGLGICLWITYRRFGPEWDVYFGSTINGSDCTGADARSAVAAGW